MLRLDDMALDWSPIGIDPNATNPADDFIGRETVAELRAGIDTLPARQRDILIAAYRDEKSFYALAQEGGLSPRRISQLHLTALKSLRGKLDRPEAA